MFPPRSPACPRARGPVRCPKGNLRPDLPTGTSPGQPLTWVFPAANCPGLCPVAPVGLTAGTLGSSAHPRRAAITAPTGEPVSCGTRPEHGGKQGDCATRDAFAAFATEAAVVQTAVYYGICSTHFTSSGALLSALAMPCCKQLRGQRSPPPQPGIPGEAGGAWDHWESSLGETRSQHHLPWIRASGRREMARGLRPATSQPRQTEQMFFPPKFPLPRAPAPCPELLTRAVQGWGTGPIPTAADLGQGSCPCNISPGV